MPAGMPMPAGWTMSMAWMRMPGQTWLDAFVAFVGMWILMMVAMMLPCLVPMLLAYRRSLREPDGARRDRLTAVAGAGYFAPWTLAGAVAFAAGSALAAAEMRWQALATAVPTATGVVLLLAGAVQASGWKAGYLMRCRAACAEGRAADARSAWRSGLRLGVECSLCCSGLMAVLLVGGVMDLGLMALVATAIIVERLARKPRLVARALGIAVVAAGAVEIVRALGVW